jgi:hypothetical protein
VGKESRRENRRNRGQKTEAPKDQSTRWFMGVVLLILLAGGAMVTLFATRHESVVGVAPQAGIDHWHDAYLINACGEDLPPSTVTEAPNGIHTHGRGLIHIHPTNPLAAGPNATLGEFIAAIGGELTDDAYLPGPGEIGTPMIEDEGCDGEPAILQVAYWENAWQEGEPTIITTDLADLRFDSQGGAVTLALLPEGAEIPRPPQDRLDLLESTNGGRAA